MILSWKILNPDEESELWYDIKHKNRRESEWVRSENEWSREGKTKIDLFVLTQKIVVSMLWLNLSHVVRWGWIKKFALRNFSCAIVAESFLSKFALKNFSCAVVAESFLSKFALRIFFFFLMCHCACGKNT